MKLDCCLNGSEIWRYKNVECVSHLRRRIMWAITFSCLTIVFIKILSNFDPQISPLAPEVDILTTTRLIKVKRWLAWVSFLFVKFSEEEGWGVQANGHHMGEHVTPPWHSSVAEGIHFVRSCCEKVPVEDPTVASLSFVRFLEDNKKNPYLRSLEDKKATSTRETGGKGAPTVNFPSTRETGGKGAPTVNFPSTRETGGKGAPTVNFPSTRETGGRRKSEKRDTRETPSVKSESRSNVAAGAGTDDSRPQDNRIPSGDGEVSPARFDQKGSHADPNDNGDGTQAGPGSGSAKRKEVWFSQDSARHDEWDTKRRRLSSTMERG